jgi:O-antigen/teichoic acid export membrane protein
VGNCMTMAGDGPRIRDHLGSSIRAACLTGAGLAVVTLGLWFINRMPGAGAADSGRHAALMQSLGIQVTYWILFGSVSGLVGRLYPALGLLTWSLWLSLLQRIAMTVSLVLAVSLGAGIVGATLAWVTAGATVTVFVLVDIRRRFPEYWPWWQRGSLSESLRLIAGSCGMIGVSLLDSLSLAVLVALTDRWASAVGVALFATLRTAVNAIMQGSLVILIPIYPDLSRHAAARDGDRCSALIAGAWLIATAPIAIVVTASLPIVETVFAQWTRKTLVFSPDLFVALIAGVLVRQWVSPLQTLIYCTNTIRAQFWISLARCVTSISAAAASFPAMGLTAMGIGIFVGEVVAALVAVGMTPIAFPGLCDGRCQRAGLLAALQVIGAAATLGAWWWVPSMAWLAWAVSLLAQGVLITAQWRNVHLAARNRVASLVSSFVRRLVPASVMALLAGVAVGPPDGSTTPRVDT